MSRTADSVAGIVLAAGQARRFGGQKLLESVAGRPLLQHVVDVANASALAAVVVVLGEDADVILARVRLGRALPVRNARAATGQASSLQAGLAALAEDIDAAIVLLGDMPGITPALVNAIRAKQHETGAAAVFSRWSGRRMPPCLVHRDLWPDAFALSGDVGMRHMHTGRGDVADVDVTPALGSLEDVDTREDHQRLRDRSAS